MVLFVVSQLQSETWSEMTEEREDTARRAADLMPDRERFCRLIYILLENWRSSVISDVSAEEKKALTESQCFVMKPLSARRKYIVIMWARLKGYLNYRH